MNCRTLAQVAPLALVFACGAQEPGVRVPPEGAADNVALIYQSRVDGEIEPCG